MKPNRYLALICIILATISAVVFVKWSSERNADPEWQRAVIAAQDLDKNLPKNEYEKHNLKAEDYFANPKTIALCKAIEEKDTAKVKAILAMGANANDRGKDGASPLFWAYPDNRFEIVRVLLEQGADPNAKIDVEIGDHDWFFADTFMLFSCRTHMDYFNDVVAFGGDPISKNKFGKSPIHMCLDSIAFDRDRRVLILLDMGANINETNNSRTVLRDALSRSYKFTLKLLERNADPFILDRHDPFYFSHDLVQIEREFSVYKGPTYRPLIEKLIDEMKRRGEDFDAVRRELDEWNATEKKYGVEQSQLRDEWRVRVVNRVEAIKKRIEN